MPTPQDNEISLSYSAIPPRSEIHCSHKHFSGTEGSEMISLPSAVLSSEFEADAVRFRGC
jgi:hypothetical protein